jgi:transposase
VTEAGNLRLDRAAIKEASRYDGKWVLETNDDTISLEDAALGYKSLLIIERCFRTLKRTQIQMMPMYHWAHRDAWKDLRSGPAPGAGGGNPVR